MSAASGRERAALLRALPLFDSMGDAELATLASRLVEEEHRKGTTICREGEAGDRLFIVLSGELDVLSDAGGTRLVQQLGAGDIVGEMSLLLGIPRTATVVVRRTARLLSLDRPTFERTVLRNSRALEHISRVLSKRLVATTRGEVTRSGPLVVATTGEAGLRGKSLVAATLAELLRRASGRETLLVVARHPGQGDGAHCLPLDAAGPASETALDAAIERDDQGAAVLAVRSRAPGDGTAAVEALLRALGDRFAFVVLDLALPDAGAEQVADEVADVHVRLVAAGGPRRAPEDCRPRRFEIVNLHNAASAPPPISLCEPFVMREDPSLAALDLRAQARHLAGTPRSGAATALHRLARKLLGSTVGVALGGGAAFGIAHIGVLQVLERAGVPLDVLAGTSMGSVVALAYAAGTRPDDMARLARGLGTPIRILRALDPTLAKAGLLAGRRMVEALAPFLNGARHFEDLRYPCRAVATDIETGERVEIGAGRLDAAFRASSSVPLIWAPVRHEGRVLVDGVMVDPVPAEVAYGMGADFCVAVNVIARPEKGAKHVLARLSRWADWLNPLAYLGDGGTMPNAFDVYLNSLQVLWHELGVFKAVSADVRINPDLSGFTWTDFHRPGEIIDRGAAAAERALPDIRRALQERMAGSGTPRPDAAAATG